MKLMRVTSVDYLPRREPENYSPDDLTVRVRGRGADGEPVVRYVLGTRPRIWVPADEAVPPGGPDEPYQVLDVEEGYESHDGQALKAVTLAHPKQAERDGAFKEEFSFTAEADIPYYRRVTWDHGLSGYIRVPDRERCHVDEIESDVSVEDVEAIEPRVCIADIEVLPGDGSFDEMKEAADQPIIAATLYDTYDDEYLSVVVDPEGLAEGSAVRDHLRDHWGEHDLDHYAEADVSLVQAETEADLVNVMVGFVQRTRPDIATGWNFVDFDWYYLLKRAKKLDGVDRRKLSDLGTVRGTHQTAVDGLPSFDQMSAYTDKMTFHEWRSSALEYVASEELGVGKIPGMNVGEAYEHDRSKLVAYNLLDVQLCAALDDREGIESFFLDVAEMAAVQIYDTEYEMRVIDGFIGSRRGRDQVMPNQRDANIVQPAGGLVLSPGQGVYENVAVLDLASLYPSSMITANISPETLITYTGETAPEGERWDDVVTVPGMPEKEDDVGGTITADHIEWERSQESMAWSMRPKLFSLHRQGVLAEFVGHLFDERQRFKDLRDQYEPGDDLYDTYDRKQAAVKVIMNSFYGAVNSPFSRWARNGIGDAITGLSRYVLWRAVEMVESWGYEVIYGDTDSLLIALGAGRSKTECVKDAKGLCTQLNDAMDQVADEVGLPEQHPFLAEMGLAHGTDRHCWEFEFEKFYGSFIQVGSKKRYAGNLVWKEGHDVDDLDVTGFESKRADVPEVTAEVQEAVLKKVLAGRSFNDVSGYVRDRIDYVKDHADSLHEIGIPISLNKPLGSYGNIPRARAARFSNEHLGREFDIGDDPWMYYLRETPPFVSHTDVLALEWHEDLPEGYVLDKPKTVEKAFESALSPIVEEVGWTFNEVREGKRNQPASDESVMEYDGDPFTSGGGSDDEPDEPSDDGPDWAQGAAAW